METKKFFLNKLVRDKSIELLKQRGCTHVESYTLDDNDEFVGALAEKIVEELEEVFDAESREAMVEELADIEEVLASFKELVEISQEEIDLVREKKRSERGGYSERIFIEYVEAKVGSPAYKYAQEKEAKYPQIVDGIEEDEE